MKITITFFKSSGKYYMDEDFEIPDKTENWNVSNELKKKLRFKKLVSGLDGFTATGLTPNGVPFLVSPYNF